MDDWKNLYIESVIVISDKLDLDDILKRIMIHER